MRRKFNVIQINGFRGIICALGILACLIAGFVVFPGYVFMSIWNLILPKFFAIQSLGLIQGVLLWGITAVSYMIIRKRHVIVSFKNPTELTEDELDEVMDRIKYETTAQMMTDIITKSKMENKPNMINLDNTVNATRDEDKAVNKNIDN